LLFDSSQFQGKLSRAEFDDKWDALKHRKKIQELGPHAYQDSTNIQAALAVHNIFTANWVFRV
jgi:hypothetical protein